MAAAVVMIVVVAADVVMIVDVAADVVIVFVVAAAVIIFVVGAVVVVAAVVVVTRTMDFDLKICRRRSTFIFFFVPPLCFLHIISKSVAQRQCDQIGQFIGLWASF